MKKILILVGCLLFALPIVAQDFTLSGLVNDESQQPLPGVNVFVKGTSNGTSTDFDGNFTLNNVSTGDVIVFSYISFRKQEITVTNQNPLNVTMVEDVNALDEVVVVGYGTQTKKEITGAVSVVGTETIEELNPQRVEQALQGQVAGVNVTAQSGSPGSASNIQIRGISTNGDSRPLILVDGNVIEDLSVINPGDIASINVLKDATAGIYGVRAANGVILITTKTGKYNSELTFNYDFYGGYQETERTIPVLNATEYGAIINEAFAAGGQNIPFPVLGNLRQGTNWQDEVFQTAPIINHSLTVNGGGEKYRFSASSALLTQDGIVGGSKANFRRYTTRINFNYDILENLNLTTNLIYTGTERKALAENAIGSVLFNALNNAPTLGVRNANGDFTFSEGLGNEVINPLAQIANSFNTTKVDKISGKVGLNYSFWNDFSFENSIQFNYSEVQGRNFSPTSFFGSGKVFNNIGRPSLSVNKDIFRDYTFDSFLNYQKTIGENHNVKGTLGMSVFRTQGLFSGSLVGFFENPVNFASADIENTVDQNNDLRNSGLSGRFDERLLSYFVRAQYDYKGKYLVSAVMRRDGSTKFGPDNRFGYFPSGSLGWIVSDEEFLKDNELLNFLKFRASYGILGNDRIASNGFRGILDGEGVYVFDGTRAFGRAVGVLPNPAIQWEEQTTLDIGADIQLFNGAIDITADYFTKTTDGLLLQPPTSGILGVAAPGAQSPVVNAGEIKNSGVEFAIGYNYIPSEDFSFKVNYNATFLKNEVVSVNNGVGFLQGGAFGVGQEPPSRMEAGKPIGYFYGLETNGLFQNQAEVAAHATQADAAPGDLRFVDQNNDGIINQDDRTDIGNPIPDATMGLNLSVKYKAIDFTSYAFASIGNEIVRNYERNQPLVNKSVYVLDRWVGEGTSNSIPRVTTGATSNNLFSDYFVEDGSFLRIQNAQLGYTLPNDLMERFGADKLRVYLSVNNLYTFSKYRGFDPSGASGGSPIGGGIDQGFYPVPRTYLLGLNLKF